MMCWTAIPRTSRQSLTGLRWQRQGPVERVGRVADGEEPERQGLRAGDLIRVEVHGRLGSGSARDTATVAPSSRLGLWIGRRGGPGWSGRGQDVGLADRHIVAV